MDSISHSSAAALILALTPGLMAAGGAEAAPCPTTAQIETAVGYPVTSRPMPVDGCMYELTGRYRGVILTVVYQPATRANDVFAEIRERVKGFRGKDAQPDSLKLGEGGWSYRSSGKTEAAAVSQGRLYHVEMSYGLFESLIVREGAAAKVIELAMRAAPGTASTSGAGTNGAPFDACLLATNAEVSEIAEVPPDLARFWEAPTASFGGSHCDYGGGSIRVYQDKAPGAALESTLKGAKVDQAARVPVAGIGDKAFFMIPFPDDKYKRVGLLAVFAGSRVLQLTLDSQGDEPIEATRPRLEKLARLVLPRLR
jgi:hypothetical protein